MRKMMKNFLLILLIPYTLLGANIEIISKISGGSGSYNSPYLIDSDSLKWKTHDGGYKTTVHSAGHRSCATLITYYIQGSNNEYTFTNICGKYYVCIKTENNDYLQKIWFILRIPPVKSYSGEYYNYPVNNKPPIPIIKMANIAGGNGSNDDPYIVTDEVVKFYINGKDDDGYDDIKYGCMNWCVDSQGHHPRYNGPMGTNNMKETFLYYNQEIMPDAEYFTVLQEWDTNEAISENGEYNLWLIIYDQHGCYSDYHVNFIIDKNAKPSDNICPLAPKNLDISVGEKI